MPNTQEQRSLFSAVAGSNGRRHVVSRRHRSRSRRHLAGLRSGHARRADGRPASGAVGLECRAQRRSSPATGATGQSAQLDAHELLRGIIVSANWPAGLRRSPSRRRSRTSRRRRGCLRQHPTLRRQDRAWRSRREPSRRPEHDYVSCRLISPRSAVIGTHLSAISAEASCSAASSDPRTEQCSSTHQEPGQHFGPRHRDSHPLPRQPKPPPHRTDADRLSSTSTTRSEEAPFLPASAGSNGASVVRWRWDLNPRWA